MIDLGHAGREGWAYLRRLGHRKALLRIMELARLGLLGPKLRLLLRRRRPHRLRAPHPFPYEAYLDRHRRKAGSPSAFRERRVGATPDRRARVVFVVSDFGIGGGNRVIHRHLTTLAQNDFGAELWSLAGPPLDRWQWHPAIRTRVFETYEDLIAELRTIDAVKVATWWETALPVWLSSIDKGLPVFLIQDIETSYYRNDQAMIGRVLDSYRPEFTYLANTQLLKDRMEAELSLPAIAIGLGYDADTYRPVAPQPRSRPLLLVAARREPLKNFAYAKAIIRQLTDVLQVECEIVAFGPDGDLRQDLPAVRFIAAPTDIALAALYASASCLLSTSAHEGFGLPPLEAMACGCPVATTDAVGNREYIADGHNCLVIPHGDAPAAARLVQTILTDATIRRALREAGLETARRYTWPAADRRLLAAMAALSTSPNYGDPLREASLGPSP